MLKQQNKYRPVRGLEFQTVRFLAFLNMFWVGIRLYRNPLRSLAALKKLQEHGKKVLGESKMRKAFCFEGKYGWDMFHPLWPSLAFNRYFYHHLEEVIPSGRNLYIQRLLLVTITKKCPLQCEHCSEGETLNNKDRLTRDELETQIGGLVERGISAIVYSGGEPLHRFDDLIYLAQRFRKMTSQWVYSSGFGLTEEKAEKMKAAGIEGVAISLDHHEPEKHNLFRGHAESYNWVVQALENCHKAGLITCVNLCPTKAYIAAGGPAKFLNLMREWKVPMVNALEPRATGNYAGKDVELSGSEFEELKALFYRINFNKKYEDWPIFTVPAVARKYVGCGGGNRYLLLDYDGTLRPCPFCKTIVTDLKERKSVHCLAD